MIILLFFQFLMFFTLLATMLFSCKKQSEKTKEETSKKPKDLRVDFIGKYQVKQTKVYGGMYYNGIFTYVKDTVISVNLGTTSDTYSILGQDKQVGNHVGNCSSYSHNDLYLQGDSIYYYVTCEGLGGYTKHTLEGHKISTQP